MARQKQLNAESRAVQASGPEMVTSFNRLNGYLTNHQVKRFNSYHWDPLAEAIDAYSQKWCGENNL